MRPVDPSVEVAAQEWEPVSPSADSDVPSTVIFVDGIRRIDASVWIADSSGLDQPGVCATVAAGALRCSPGGASLDAVLVRRAIFTAADQAEALDLGGPMIYELRVVSAGTDEALYLAVHNYMTAVEHELSSGLDDDSMIVFDGPLGLRQGQNSAGYIKTQHVQYLDAEQQQIIGRLSPGQRTPLFHIGGDIPNWSWYLRLPSGGTGGHSMTGVVRVELPGLGDVASVAARADGLTAALPRFASEAHKDARAPQNLYPIAGLERELRRRLGDGRLLDRALRRRAADTHAA